MSDPFYCKLYIDTDETIDGLRKALDEHCRILFHDLNLETSLRRNEAFDSSARNQGPYDFIRSARFYADIETADETPQQAAGFQSAVATLVSRLRDGGRIVMAACDFEDLIIGETGWNWTKDDPEPPRRVAMPLP
ncbi:MULTISPECIES: hypothetical protein [unclassified Rhizobium]|uniref:hypothetical protein n=1 Tax=unclassified Rhizobium TaxID=2613769 RepID=UPI0007151B34|nr:MULTISPECIES: hypothetical protein [unclassified Rhizobium]KQS83175.1 hypothetical protein ASG50_12330 [Rhizobium sp. Leaf386]KQS88938.1 hypothetical protein ASG42_14300 [Rhizobium sp. Leaf391]KQT92786.1 hypothetical protein ASG68_15490 [Rhizobium sp. Leaf453]